MHYDRSRWPGRTTSAGATVGNIAHAYNLKKLVQKHNAKSLLDYGCGKGFQYHEDELHLWLGIMPHCFDPFVDRYKEPVHPDMRFDGVFCIDVLEHVEEKEVLPLLVRLVKHAEKFLYVTACTRPAGAILPDGRNAHITLKPAEWWRERFRLAIRAGDKSSDYDARLEFTP